MKHRHARHISADTALSAVKAEGEIIIGNKLIEMLRGIELFGRISAEIEAEGRAHIVDSDTAALSVSDDKRADIRAVAVFLRSHISVLELVNTCPVDCYLSARFSVNIGFLRASAVPFRAFE